MFMLAPADLVKGENQWPEYRDILKSLQDTAFKRAGEIWGGYTPGGITPGPRQYGIAPFRPRDIHGGGTATFVKTYNAPGSWGNIWSYSVPEDQVHSFAGLAIPDPTLIFAAFRWQIGDKILPVANVEEAHSFSSGFRLLFKQDAGKEFVIGEEESIVLSGFQERATGGRTQRIVPIGFVLHKNRENMINRPEVNN